MDSDITLSDNEIDSFVDNILQEYPKDVLLSIFNDISQDEEYQSYQNDPVGFCRDTFGETYTPDIEKMFESVRDNIVTIAKSSNGTGKTHGAARMAIWWKKAFPNSQVYTAAAPPEENLKKLLWGEIGSIVLNHPDLFKNDKVSTLNIKTSPLEFIAGVSIPSSGTSAEREAKFSGKHAPNILFIIDEGDAVPDEVYRGIESCMSGGNVRLLIMFNPRAAVGAPYRMERDGLANIVTLSAFDHPNVLTGEDLIPGAVTRAVTARRINEWCRPLIEDEEYKESSCFKLPLFLEGYRAPKLSTKELYPPLKPGIYKVINPAFSYMVLARYPGQAENQLISREWIEAARDRYDKYVLKYGEKPPEGTQGIMGQDVAEQGLDANVTYFRYGTFVFPRKSWGGVDTVVTATKAIDEYYKMENIVCCNVDGTGLGSGVAPYMVKHGKCVAVGIKVVNKATETTDMGIFDSINDQIGWAVREWLKTEDAMLPPGERLIEELQVLTYRIDKGRVKLIPKDDIKKLIQRSPDDFDALKLTFAPINIKDGYNYD